MDLSCDDKILQSVRELLRDVVLPRLTQLEAEVRELRKVTWPVCQSLREKSQLTDIQNKKRFLEFLDADEVKMLLQEKASMAARPIQYSTPSLSSDELFELNKSFRSL
jgi:hypothetical protein